MKIYSILRIIIFMLLHPKAAICNFSFSKIKVLSTALKYESPDHIISNSKKFFTGSNPNQVIKTDKDNPSDSQTAMLHNKNELLIEFLSSNSVITFKESKNPDLSIFIKLNSSAVLNFTLLKSIQNCTDVKYEIIILYNNLKDELCLVDKIHGVKILNCCENDTSLTNEKITNLIKGKYALFISSSAEIYDSTISSSLKMIKKDKECGAVLAKFKIPDLRLNEVGNIFISPEELTGNGSIKNTSPLEKSSYKVSDYFTTPFLLTKNLLLKEFKKQNNGHNHYCFKESEYCKWLQKKSLNLRFEADVIVNDLDSAIEDTETTLSISKEITQNYDNGRTKRIAIFASYNPNGRIAKYILYYLKELRKVVDGIVFIADNPIQPDEIEKIENLACYFSFNRHGEYDFGSYKIGISYCKESGLLNNTEELIICNDSCFGPVFPFENIFNSQLNNKLDFWGLTINTQFERHIQSYFYVFKKQVFTHNSFRLFWDNVRKEENVDQVIQNYEVKFSNYLASHGFTYGSFVPENMNEIENKIEKKYFDSNPTVYPLTILEKYRCPLIKLKAVQKTEANRESNLEIFNYISKVNKELLISI